MFVIDLQLIDKQLSLVWCQFMSNKAYFTFLEILTIWLKLFPISQDSLYVQLQKIYEIFKIK